MTTQGHQRSAEGLLARPLQPLADQRDLIELFETVFGHTITPRMWAWKYRPPWTNRHYCWVGICDRKVIGYFGCVPLRGWIKGREVPFFQFADFMVHPKYRRKYDYFSLGLEALVEDLGGTHPEYLIYGFSDHRAFLGFRRSGLGGLVEKAVIRHVHPTGTPCAEGLEIRDWGWREDSIEQVWERQRDDLEIGLVRDVQYLSWRYGGHPVFSYRLFGVHRDGQPVGWMVIGNDGAGKHGGPKEIPVVDMLLPEDLIRPAMETLAGHLDHALITWLPARVAPGLTKQQQETGTHVFHFRKDSIVDTEHLRQHLYYTMGDVDWW